MDVVGHGLACLQNPAFGQIGVHQDWFLVMEVEDTHRPAFTLIL